MEKEPKLQICFENGFLHCSFEGKLFSPEELKKAEFIVRWLNEDPKNKILLKSLVDF